MSRSVYLAARFARLPELLAYKDDLEAIEVEVTSRWLLGGHAWVGTPDEELPVTVQARFAVEDIADIARASTVVCFTEPPNTGPARGGRHVELGWALATQKRVIVVGHRENVFCCHPRVEFAPDWATALDLIQDGLWVRFGLVAITEEPS